MPISIFSNGNYPPGCSGTPWDDDAPCLACGQAEDNCECAECPVCERTGCMEHVDVKDLVRRYERTTQLVFNLEIELRRRFLKTPPTCIFCKEKLSFEEWQKSYQDGCYHGKCYEASLKHDDVEW